MDLIVTVEYVYDRGFMSVLRGLETSAAGLQGDLHESGVWRFGGGSITSSDSLLLFWGKTHALMKPSIKKSIIRPTFKVGTLGQRVSFGIH